MKRDMAISARKQELEQKRIANGTMEYRIPPITLDDNGLPSHYDGVPISEYYRRKNEEEKEWHKKYEFFKENGYWEDES